jgi:hypothetical protein
MLQTKNAMRLKILTVTGVRVPISDLMMLAYHDTMRKHFTVFARLIPKMGRSLKVLMRSIKIVLPASSRTEKKIFEMISIAVGVQPWKKHHPLWIK